MFGVLAGFHPGIPPFQKFAAQRANGAAALAGNFGAAKQHNIRLPAIIQIQADQPLHLGSAKCLAECGLRFLA